MSGHPTIRHIFHLTHGQYVITGANRNLLDNHYPRRQPLDFVCTHACRHPNKDWNSNGSNKVLGLWSDRRLVSFLATNTPSGMILAYVYHTLPNQVTKHNSSRLNAFGSYWNPSQRYLTFSYHGQNAGNSHPSCARLQAIFVPTIFIYFYFF